MFGKLDPFFVVLTPMTQRSSSKVRPDVSVEYSVTQQYGCPADEDELASLTATPRNEKEKTASPARVVRPFLSRVHQTCSSNFPSCQAWLAVFAAGLAVLLVDHWVAPAVSELHFFDRERFGCSVLCWDHQVNTSRAAVQMRCDLWPCRKCLQCRVQEVRASPACPAAIRRKPGLVSQGGQICPSVLPVHEGWEKRDWCLLLGANADDWQRQQLKGPALNAICHRLWLVRQAGRTSNMLVFGLGFDSNLWLKINNGRVVFLENLQKWVDKQQAQVQIASRVVNYSSILWLADWMQCRPASLDAGFLGQVRDLMDVCWDVILVDSPEAWGGGRPGRMQSMYAAHWLATDGTVIFADDVDRRIEIQYALNWLVEGNSHNVSVFGSGHHGLTAMIN